MQKIIFSALCLLSCVAAPLEARSSYATSTYGAYWGIHTSINLYRCSPGIMRSQTDIERFIRTLFTYLGLTRNGNPSFVYHYAGNGYSSGLNAFQQGNAHSDIVVRMDELNNDIYIDFFSCMAYDPYDIARRARDFFYALDMSYEETYR